VIGAVILALAGCASEPPVTIPEPLRAPLSTADQVPAPSPDIAPAPPPPSGPRFSTTPSLPSTGAKPANTPIAPLQAGDARQVTVNIEGLAVPAFINEVYGNLLGVSFQMDAAVQKKTDTVNLRLTSPQPAAKVRILADQTLKDYGVTVEPRGEVLRFTTGEAQRGPDSPVFVFGPRLPAGLNEDTRVALFLPLEVVNVNQVASWMRLSFAGQKLEIGEDSSRNAVVLTGPAGIVRQAAEAARLLDQPALRGRYSVSIEPAAWTASQLAKRLDDVLQIEGYALGRPGSAAGAIVLLPLDEVNLLLVFAADPALLAYVRRWVEKLDQPRPEVVLEKERQSDGFFYYLARNVAAEELAKTVSPLLSGVMRVSAPPPRLTGPAGATASAMPPPVTGDLSSSLVVDKGRNAVIFNGSGAQWQKLRPVLEAMDQPARLVLIEVTVAEITLGNTQETGIDWIFKNVQIGDWTGTISNTLDLGTKGFNTLLTQPDGSRILLNALATNSQVSILSNPKIMVRNGEEATIDVGTEVPILTSQATTAGTGQAGDPAILQQIQYRKTGVLLKVKPNIYAGRRVDLQVQQEVSEAQRNTTSSISSPQILNRKINTSLTLKDGGSVLLGGLVSTNSSFGDRGIPLIKDIPVLGRLFRADSSSTNRTELIILITPYILGDEREAQAITAVFRQRLSFGAPPEPPVVNPAANP
jgi:general secretion pathway protein D